jgi:hypothetical protein
MNDDDFLSVISSRYFQPRRNLIHSQLTPLPREQGLDLRIERDSSDSAQSDPRASDESIEKYPFPSHDFPRSGELETLGPRGRR